MVETLPSTPFTPADALVLGRTQETRGSEIQAGARAELTPNPVTLALASLRGRAVAQTMIWLAPDQGILNYTAARIPILAALMLRAIPPVPHPLLIDTSAGFSPMSLMVAEGAPHAHVIEIDRAEVIRSRQHRLRKAKITLPPNLETISADLGQTSLPEVLGGRVADVIDFTGAYFSPAQLRRTAAYLHSILSEQGTVLSCYPYRPAMEYATTATRFFKQQVGDLPGGVDDVTALKHYFLDAGYRDVEIYFPSQLAPELGLRTPILDMEISVIARK